MKPGITAPFAHCVFRGFAVQEEGPKQLIIKHKKVRGTWVFGSYMCKRQTNQHIIYTEDGSKYVVLPETLGMREPNSHKWPGDTCFFEGVRGVVRFGRHYDPTTYDREEVHYYIEWMGDEMKKLLWRSDLLYWAKKPHEELVWSGTIWDPASEYRQYIFK